MTGARRWILLAACVALDVWLARELAPADDGVRYAWLGTLFTAIGAAFGWLADKAVTIGIVIYHATVIVGRAIWDVAVRVAGVFRSTFGLLRNFWSSVLRPFVSWTWRQIDRLAGWLQRTFKPVLDFLYKVRAELLKLYDKWLRPIFDTITVLRRTLQVLSFLRLEWARELDRKLAELEDRLLLPLRFALRYINEVINIVNRIVTLDGYLQRLTLIRSLMLYQADALKVWWTSIHKPLAGEKRTDYERPLETRTIAAVAEDYQEYVAHGRGPDAGRIDEHARDYELRLRALRRAG